MVKCLRGLKWLRESERERASERGRVFVFEFVCVCARACVGATAYAHACVSILLHIMHASVHNVSSFL